FVKAVRGPMPWTLIMPTGGVSPDEANLRAWFEAGVACVGMGSKLITKELVAARDFDAIRRRTAETIQLIRSLKAELS
ncbi:MAG: bifunctional 4-hydroxy-2-oxoglutarate aldolase/2-dehydro-3-deoxy-phosphogluconate aldolase, partial [Caldilineae bacterium]